MSWILIRAALGSLGKWLSGRSFWQLAFGAALLLAGWEYIGKRTEQRHANKSDAQLIKCSTGRQADRAAYAKAQADAAVANKAQVAKVEQQQQKVTDNVEAQYRADLARLERLRPSNAAPQRAPSAAGAPTPGSAASGPRNQAVPLPGPELLRAQETELQLNALIDWVLQQSAVDPNKP